MQGFRGIMIASFWSITTSVNMVKMVVLRLPLANWLLFGGIFIRVLDSVIPHLHQRIGDKSQYREGIRLL